MKRFVKKVCWIFIILPIVISCNCTGIKNNKSKAQNTNTINSTEKYYSKEEPEIFKEPCDCRNIDIERITKEDTLIISNSAYGFNSNYSSCWFSIREYAENIVPEEKVSVLIVLFWDIEENTYNQIDEESKRQLLIASYEYNNKTGASTFTVDPYQTGKYIENE